MNRWRILLQSIFIFFITYFFFFNTFLLHAQTQPIVQVDPIVNLSDEVWLDAVCVAATDNVLFTLKLLGRFQVVSDLPEEEKFSQLKSSILADSENFDTSVLKSRAETGGYDNILFGSCSIEDGSYVITMSAYDLALDNIIYSGSTVVESVFDTFEAVDEITYQTVEGFSGIHVTYGSLVLVPPATGEPFSFTIDGIPLPEGTYSVEKIPSGVHKLTVNQERPLGLYEAVHDILIEEGRESQFDIFLPELTGEELTVFNQADRYLTLLSMGKEPGMPLAMNNMYNLTGSLFFKEFRPELVNKYDHWISLFNGNVSLSDDIHIDNRFLIKRSLWSSPVHQNVSNRNVSLYSQYLIPLKIAEYSNSILVPDIKTINVDGKSDDWNDVTQSLDDPSGDANFSIPGVKEAYDLVEIKFAIDSDNLYVMLRSSDGKYIKNRLVHKLHFHGNGQLYFDFWLAKTKKLWVGWDRVAKDPDTEWSTMAQQVKFRIGDILEVAIPLGKFTSSPVFMPEMGMWLALNYASPVDDSKQYMVDRMDYIPSIRFPLVELMIKKDRI